MATVTGLTAARMLEIEAASVIDGEVVGDNLQLTTHGGVVIDAGNVRGPQGLPGADGLPGPPGEDGAPGADGPVASVTQETWKLIGAAGQPAFQNGFSQDNVYGGYETVAYRKTPDGKVSLRGMALHATSIAANSGFVLFALPVGYRPAANRDFATDGYNAFARITIQTNGNVTLFVNIALPQYFYVALDGITFDVGQETFPAGAASALTGEMKLWTSYVIPPGYLEANGDELPASAVDLIALYEGNPHGVGPNSRPRLPDMRGRVPVGSGQGTGLTNRVIGTKAGTETHVLTAAQLPTHEHIITGADGTTQLNVPYVAGGNVHDLSLLSHGQGYNNGMARITGGGSGAAHQNMQPSLVVKYIVKT